MWNEKLQSVSSEVVRDSNSKEWDCRQFYLIQVHSYDIDLFSETLVCRTPLGRPLHAQYSQVRWCSPGILAYWTNGDLVIIGIRIEAAGTCPLLLMMDTSLIWTPFLRPKVYRLVRFYCTMHGLPLSLMQLVIFYFNSVDPDNFAELLEHLMTHCDLVLWKKSLFWLFPSLI